MRYAALAAAFVVGTALLAFLVAFAGNLAVEMGRSVSAARRRRSARARRR